MINKRKRVSLAAILLAMTMSNVVAKNTLIADVPSIPYYQNMVTKRQVVDVLINDALKAYESPARISHAGLTSRLPDQLDNVIQPLVNAYELEPYRIDLLFSIAGAYSNKGEIDHAIDYYKKILMLVPDDIDALTYLSVWTRYKKESAASDSYLSQLAERDNARRQQVGFIFRTIDAAIAQPVSDQLPSDVIAELNQGDTAAIVTLGYALNPDGSMHDILIKRLEKTRDAAELLPRAVIIVTGGVPQNNKTEAKLMRDWLVQQGIPSARIREDNSATTTVENALYSRYILAIEKSQQAVILSSASHVRRGKVLFEIATQETGPKGIRFFTLAAMDKSLDDAQAVSDGELRAIYRDALKTLGLWSFRSPPLQSR